MRKKILFIFLALLMLGAIGYFYVNNVLLPVQLKALVAEKSGEFLGREVTIDGFQFHVFKGAALTGVKVARAGNPDQDFVTVEEISFRFLFNGWKSVFIPNIKILSPKIHLFRDSGNDWNFTDLLDRKTGGDDTSEDPAWSLSAGGVTVENARIEVTDASFEETFVEQVVIPSLSVGLSLPAKIRAQTSLELPLRATSLTLSGDYFPRDQNFEFSIQGKTIPLTAYKNYLAAHIPVDLTTLDVSSIDLTAKQTSADLNIYGEISIPAIDVSVDKTRLSGSDLNLTGLNLTRTDNVWSGQGRLEFTDGNVRSGDLSFQGGLTSRVASLTIDGSRFSLEADAEITTARLAPRSDQSFEGDLTLTQLKVETSDGTTSVQGRIEAKNAALAWARDGKLTGDFAVNNLDARIGKEMIASGSLNMTSSDIEFNGRRSTFASLQSSAFKFTKTDARTELTTDLELVGAALRPAEEYLIEGSLRSDQSVITLTGSEISVVTDLTARPGLLVDIYPYGVFQGALSAPRFAIHHSPETLKADGTLNFSESTWRHADGMLFTASPDIKISVNQNFTDDVLDYTIDGELAGAHGEGLPEVGRVENISGSFRLKPESARLESMTLRVLNTDLTAEGTITNFNNPVFDLQVAGDDLNLASLTQQWPMIAEKIPGTVTGSASVDVRYQGPVSPFNPEGIQGSAEISNGTFQHETFEAPLKNISGELTADRGNITWSGLNVTILDRTLLLEGSLKDLKQPAIETRLTGEDLSLKTNLSVSGRNLAVKEFDGQYLSSTFKLNGLIKLGDTPHLDLDGNLAIEPEDFRDIHPVMDTYLDEYTPRGRINIRPVIKGPPQSWRDWNLSVGADAAALVIKGISLEHVTLQYRQSEKRVQTANLAGGVFGGAFQLTGTADLELPSLPVKAKIDLRNVNLKSIREAYNLEKTELEGFLELDVSLNGPVTVPDRMHGSGQLVVTEGFISHQPTLGGIKQILLGLLPEYNTIIFNDAASAFDIADSQIRLRDTLIKGTPVDLRIKGSIGFNQALNLNVTSSPSARLIQKNQDVRSLPTSLVSRAVTIPVRGTLTQPEFKQPQFAPLNLLESAAEILGTEIKGAREIQNILGDLLGR